MDMYILASAFVLILFIVIIYAIFLISRKKNQVKFWRDQADFKSKSLDNVYENIEALSETNASYLKRIKELEDMKGDAFQVKLRNEIIEVNVDFTKMEMVMVLAGASVLLKDTKDPVDAQIYIDLINKINGFIGDMKE
ncbi:unnamed protein product [marine sediment metagenome]|uniref:Uncharacterized protein n=1 Tax=marine sediment metagenome TaxID=412755 RepID=X0RZD8_9ZZZZ